MRSYLALLNFKANHRKLILSDMQGEPVSMILSANPHHGSSAHSNVALLITGAFARELYQSENSVSNLSHTVLSAQLPPLSQDNSPGDDGYDLRVQLITENRIERKLLSLIGKAEHSDTLSPAMFYLSDRDILRTLLAAAERGVVVRLILDSNKDAFGHEKNGIPNRESAAKLVHRSGGKIQVRWYDTHGEQFHSKITFLHRTDGSSAIVLGSANLTRRNIDNYNLETDVFIEASGDCSIADAVDSY